MADRIEVEVLLEEQQVVVKLRDATSETVALFASVEESKRVELAAEAWRIGLRALQSAFTQAEQARLRDIGKTLMDDFEKQLKAYAERQNEVVSTVLAGYFDPKDGRVVQRLDNFVRDDGQLVALLKQHLAPENSVLASTLARNLGETSPLFKLLSPEEAQGVVKQIEAKMAETLNASRKSIAQDMDPLVKDSPIARFLEQLKQEIENADGDREKQLKTLTKELDANDENSALSKLMRQTQEAQQQLAAAINPDKPDSPMAIIKTSLTTLLQAHVKEQKDFQEETKARQEKFEKEVLTALQRIETKRAQNLQTTGGGFEFEEAVYTFVEAATQNAAYFAERTGATVGAIRNCKKGDQVVLFTEDSAFAGAGVVIEAKQDQSYTIDAALEEMREAKENRDCQIGLFVMAATHAPPGFPRFARYGSTILVTWNAEDPGSDAYLQGGLLCALGLATRMAQDASDADVNAIADIGARIQAEVERLEKMKGFVSNITRDAGKIEKEIGTAQKKLNLAFDNAQEALRALKIQIRDEVQESGSPIELDGGAVEEAREVARKSTGDEPARRVSVGGPQRVAARRAPDTEGRE